MVAEQPAWDPAAQVATVEQLLVADADPQATDKGGVTSSCVPGSPGRARRAARVVGTRSAGLVGSPVELAQMSHSLARRRDIDRAGTTSESISWRHPSAPIDRGRGKNKDRAEEMTEHYSDVDRAEKLRAADQVVELIGLRAPANDNTAPASGGSGGGLN